jgi:hypothetical protein
MKRKTARIFNGLVAACFMNNDDIYRMFLKKLAIAG